MLCEVIGLKKAVQTRLKLIRRGNSCTTHLAFYLHADRKWNDDMHYLLLFETIWHAIKLPLFSVWLQQHQALRRLSDKADENSWCVYLTFVCSILDFYQQPLIGRRTGSLESAAHASLPVSNLAFVSAPVCLFEYPCVCVRTYARRLLLCTFAVMARKSAAVSESGQLLSDYTVTHIPTFT